MNNRGTLVIYTGCSGVGKGTIMKELLRRDPNIRLSVSNTTREPRDGEIDGVHYRFVTREEFLALADADGYIEYAEYCDNLYGTPKQHVEELLAAGYDVFLEIEVQGGLQVMEQFPDVLSIFILPPSIEELENRLRGRGTETEEVIRQRLAEAKNELAVAQQYRFRVVNDDLNTAVNEVLDILQRYR